MNDEELKELLQKNNWKVTYHFKNGGLITATRGLSIVNFYSRKDKYCENHEVKTDIRKRVSR